MKSITCVQHRSCSPLLATRWRPREPKIGLPSLLPSAPPSRRREAHPGTLPPLSASPETPRKPPKTPRKPPMRAVPGWIGVSAQGRDRSRYKDLVPRTRRRTPSRIRASLARPRTRVNSGDARQLALWARPSLRPPPPANSHRSQTCLGARVPIRGHDPEGTSSCGRHPARLLPRPATVFFLQRQGPPWPMSTETTKRAHRRDRRAIAR
jgi:hypothetical protein